jgi:hypothetical protein
MEPTRRPLLRVLAALPALPRVLAPAAFAALCTRAASAQQHPAEPDKQPVNAGPYVPSPDGVVTKMLDMAGVGPDDVLVDMGSGDGRIVLTAAKLRGARGLGIEIDEKLVALSVEAARREGVADRARFVRQDLFATDVSEATVVTLYLLPETVNMLREKLRRELRPGARVIVHDYPLAGWLPETWQRLEEPEKKNATGVPTATVYLYRIPASVHGRWQASVPPELTRQRVALDLRQQWQKLDGMATVGGREVPLDDVELRGDRVAFALRMERGRMASFAGRVQGDALEGTVGIDGTTLPWRAVRAR